MWHIFEIVAVELLIMYVSAIVLAIPGTFISAYLKTIEPGYTQTPVKFNPFSMKVSDQQMAPVMNNDS